MDDTIYGSKNYFISCSHTTWTISVIIFLNMRISKDNKRSFLKCNPSVTQYSNFPTLPYIIGFIPLYMQLCLSFDASF